MLRILVVDSRWDCDSAVSSRRGCIGCEKETCTQGNGERRRTYSRWNGLGMLERRKEVVT